MLGFSGLTELVMATGALGTAAFGIVEGLKWTPLGSAGFGRLKNSLGKLLGTVKIAYGSGVEEMLDGLYRGERGAGALPRTLRQGVRLGLNPTNAPQIAEFLGSVEPESLKNVAEKIHSGDELDDDDLKVLGRFQLAADTRIDGALARAEIFYVGVMRMVASFVALATALIVSFTVDGELHQAIIVGVMAIPLAPIAKDVAKAIQKAADALRPRTS